MTRSFVRNLIVQTIGNVTGDEIDDIAEAGVIEVDTRDWEQIFGRLEATLDVVSGELLSTGRTIDIAALADRLHARIVARDAAMQALQGR